jgi:hypothetical protein
MTNFSLEIWDRGRAAVLETVSDLHSDLRMYGG